MLGSLAFAKRGGEKEKFLTRADPGSALDSLRDRASYPKTA
jgi:hypothetical protein